MQYLDSRLLPGYVAIENGRVSGYVFCVYEDHKAVIGDVFAVKSQYSDSSSADIESRLLESLIELLQGSPGVERIESQLLLHPSGEQTEVFERNGFQIYTRLFMRLALNRAKFHTPPPAPAGYHVRQWREDDFNNAARLIADAYRDHLDSHINDQYRSISGSLRFLHNIIRFPGCGFFDASASRVLVHTATNRLAGVLLCSRVREDVGHITQLCVSKELQGRGIGAMLVEHSASYLASHGFKSLTLTVTVGNQNAVRLYERVGFEAMHRFDAMLWEKRVG